MNGRIRDYILKSRYFQPGEESFSEICSRVASAIGKDEQERNEFLRMLEGLLFLPNSPALMNAGTRNPQLSACFVIPVGPTIPEIFRALRQGAIIQANDGGTGYSFSDIPPSKAPVGEGGGISPGPVRIMEIFDTATRIIREGGRRKGANMGILDITHPDILSFITAKGEEGALENFNISVMIPDRFMKALMDGPQDEILTIHPISGEVIRVREIFSTIVEGIYRNGEPGVLFTDTINAANPTPELGSIEATNPCGEEPLLAYESCILGSINLTLFLENQSVAWDKLGEITRLAVRFLDNAIDQTTHPLPEIAEATKKTRKIGLGVMGLHDTLIIAGIPYDTGEARTFAEEVMAFITATAVDESKRRAAEMEAFPAWEGSIWTDPIRNAALTAVAPTGTISLIAGVSPGIEPVYSFVCTRHHTAGRAFEMIHPIFSRALDDEIANCGYTGSAAEEKRREVIDHVRETGSLQSIEWLPDSFRRLYRSAKDISPDDHLRMQAAFQCHTHAAIAKTINLRSDITKDEISHAIISAWTLGLKGVTLYRIGSRRDAVYIPHSCSHCGKYDLED